MRRIPLILLGAAIAGAVAGFAYALDPPHNSTNSVDCSSCHIAHNAPGGAITKFAGNANLCESCHVTGGPATNKPFAEADQSLPGPGLPTGVTAAGTSHRWDSGASGHVQVVSPSTSTGKVQSGGAFTGRYAKTYTITITTPGNVGTAIFSWSDTLGGGASGLTTWTNVTLDQGITVSFTNGPVSPSFVAGDRWRVYVRTDINQPSTAALAARISDGKIMCSTCHNQHSQAVEPFDPSAPIYGGSGTGAGRHYQRAANDTNQMCKDCHSARNVTLSAQGSHPVGVAIPGTGFYKSPTTLPLDKTTSKVQCTTCHKPHYAQTTEGTLLRMADVRTLCTDCHTLSDMTTPASHLNTTTGVLWPGPGVAPNGPYGSTTFPQITDSSKRGFCTNCHQPHGWPDGATPTQDYLKLLVEQPDQRLCFVCHDGNGPAASNVYGQFYGWAQPYGATNYQVTSESGAKVNQRHDISAADQTYSGGTVACLNCHDPHRATNAQKASSPKLAQRPPAGSNPYGLTRDYAKTSSYQLGTYNWTYSSATTDLDPLSPAGCSLLPRWEIGAGKPKFNGFTVANTGDDTAYSAGPYNPGADTANVTYTVTVTRGGVFYNCTSACPQITVTSTGGRDNSGPTTVGWGGSANANYTQWVAVGSRGVTVRFYDPSGSTAQRELTLNDQWTIDVYYQAACASVAEPDMVEFCLACHDNNPPAGGVMSPGLYNIANSWGVTGTTDKHGRTAGNTGNNGYLKVPWNNQPGTAETAYPYAALNCTVCHEGHGSPNIFHLKSSITVRGVQMRVGGAGVSQFTQTQFSKYGAMDYVLPCFSGTTLVECSTVGSVQKDHYWGAWCSFCHDMSGHSIAAGESDQCRTGHKHTGGAF